MFQSEQPDGDCTKQLKGNSDCAIPTYPDDNEDDAGLTSIERDVELVKACKESSPPVVTAASYDDSGEANPSSLPAIENTWELTEELPVQQSSNFLKVTCANCVLYMGFILTIITALNFSINSIMNHSATSATAASQFYFTISVVTRELANVWSGEVHGVLGSRYGRKCVMLLAAVSMVCGGAISFVALLTKFVFFLVIAQIFIGFSGSFSTAVAYVADTSTNDTIWRNNGVFMASFIFFSTITMVINAFLTSNLYVLYIVCVLCGCGSFGVSFTLRDLSPSPKLRFPGTFVQLISTMVIGPCLSWSTFFKQTAFTRCLLLGMSFHTGSTAAAGAWIVNYTMVQFNFKAMQVNMFLILIFVGFASVTLVTTPFVRASNAAHFLLFASLITPVGPLFMALGPGSAFVFCLSVPFIIPGAIGSPVALTIVYGQQPPEFRGKIVGLQKLLAGICKTIGGALGGMMMVWWLGEKDAGDDPIIRPPLSTAILAIVGALFTVLAFTKFKKQDLKLYLDKE